MKDVSQPIISVVMSVYNDERYVGEAIQSILDQTYTDFEFIIINDGSTDKSLEKIKSFQDQRIQLISRENRGLVYSLNQGIKKARGKYIARQDADDISLPKKLELLVAAIQVKGVVLSATAFSMFQDDLSNIIDRQYAPSLNSLLKRELFVQNPFCHGATMFERKAAISVGGYRDIGPIEDYDLWMRLADIGDLAYVPSEQYLWRINDKGISQQQSLVQAREATKLRKNYLKNHHITDITNTQFNSFVTQLRSANAIEKKYTRRRLAVDQVGLWKIFLQLGDKKRAAVELRRLGKLGLIGCRTLLKTLIRERLSHG